MEVPEHMDEPFIMNRYNEDIVITDLKEDIQYIKFVSTMSCVACYLHICANVAFIFV